MLKYLFVSLVNYSLLDLKKLNIVKIIIVQYYKTLYRFLEIFNT